MAKSVTAGQMRTKITVKSKTSGINENGRPTESWTNIFGGTNKVFCSWVNAHGTEVYEAKRLGLNEVATITMRYSSLVNERCRIWHESDTQDNDAYEIVSIDNVGDRREFLEIKVKRLVVA